jgi:hypothetical protein
LTVTPYEAIPLFYFACNLAVHDLFFSLGWLGFPMFIVLTKKNMINTLCIAWLSAQKNFYKA